jgi:hypothetical protein
MLDEYAQYDTSAGIGSVSAFLDIPTAEYFIELRLTNILPPAQPTLSSLNLEVLIR